MWSLSCAALDALVIFQCPSVFPFKTEKCGIAVMASVAKATPASAHVLSLSRATINAAGMFPRPSFNRDMETYMVTLVHDL
jgi:hypothetical protein